MKVWPGAVILVAFAWLALPAHAQVACVGDCDGDDAVAIDELIVCVRISLGNARASTCTACDGDGDGVIEIDELIQAVRASLCGCPGCPTSSPTRTGSPTPTPTTGAICGDRRTDTAAGEECDDGNNLGGDECAANCTQEIQLRGTFDTTLTKATVQNSGVQIDINLSGGQTFRAGSRRDGTVFGPGGVTLFQPGEIPVVIRASELNFDPVRVSTVACACVRAVAAPELFGPGNAGAGIIRCGSRGLTNINYRIIQDHNTNPGDPNNACSLADGGAPDDPECDDQSSTVIPGNPNSPSSVSLACREQSGDPRCDDPTRFLHRGACISPRILTRSGGMARRGSAYIVTNTSISLLLDGGSCSTTGMPPCNEDYGPDCRACTDDDADIQPPNTLPMTTGIAEAAVFDLNDGENAINPGMCGAESRLSVIIDANLGPMGCNGGGDLGSGCTTRVEGSPLDCDLLDGGDPEDALEGASLVLAFPSIDAALIKDTVTTATFFNERR